jgi:hypothetical protein
MSLVNLLEQLQNNPQTVEFDQVMSVINENYLYTPTRFSNGDVINEAGSNEGSCKIFAFAQLNQLAEAQTLACFGIYYRNDVLGHPDGTDHGNIRNFMQSGWAGIIFDQAALTEK